MDAKNENFIFELQTWDKLGDQQFSTSPVMEIFESIRLYAQKRKFSRLELLL